MLLVSGGNGNLARSVIANLLRMTDPGNILVTTRDPQSDNARQLAAQGVTVRHADFDAPETLGPAFAGATRALLISTYADNSERLRQNLAGLEAVKAAGVEHVLYTSFLGAGPDALPEHTQLVHWPTEQAIVASGLSYTILRHALYAEIIVGDLDETLATGVLARSLGEKPCTYIARDDLGLSAATVLAGSGRENRVLNETMERSYTGDEVAEALSRCFGKPVRYERIAAEDWPAYMTEKWGMPPSLSASTVGTMRAIEAGEFDLVSDDYRKVTGRSPLSLDEFLEGVKAARG
ncbi:NmrA family NAD(P)-binding protein [Croceibacterium aestuarii]|uniref:NmrA family NAD(P)-binding protein n=1 Tax=Croceibacterium aestuarii TaxID=3064139 RepID=UPI003F715451